MEEHVITFENVKTLKWLSSNSITVIREVIQSEGLICTFLNPFCKHLMSTDACAASRDSRDLSKIG